MEHKKSSVRTILKVALPLFLGGAILYWMYRGQDFRTVEHVLLHEMDWTWMLLSFPFGIMAQVLRGWRWRQTLEPLTRPSQGADRQPIPRRKVLVNSIFLSYAASLVVPRIGEFTRCAVLKRWEGASFSRALGTVVTERIIDSLLMLLIIGLTVLIEMSTFGTFFQKTGTSLNGILSGFTLAGWVVTAICVVAAGILLWILLRRLSIYNKVKTTLAGIWEGVMSLRSVRSVPLFSAMTLGIWLCYFMHYYLTFFCFTFTEHLGVGCAMVTFIVGTIAVIVPTPNGAGPWHFAVKTMLILYGVGDEQALYFVLIVHTVQTLLIVALGVYAWARLSFISRRANQESR
ncbi:MAG: flippase-like domain-containing protein [Prevotella sp.]|nr:flippase-like domain-containing protein [Prevotella sp.]